MISFARIAIFFHKRDTVRYNICTGLKIIWNESDVNCGFGSILASAITTKCNIYPFKIFK